MSTYLVTWNPASWEWGRLASAAVKTKKGIRVSIPWSCGNNKSIKSKDRLFLLKQGIDFPKGIMASGWARSKYKRRPHWDDHMAAKGKEALFIKVSWDTILDFRVEPLLETSVIDGGEIPLVNWRTMISGISISRPVAERMEMLWQKHVQSIRGNASIDFEVIDLEDKLQQDGYFDLQNVEDGRDRQLQQIVQRRGQPRFRRKLIDAYRGRCAVTGNDVVDALEAAHILPYKGAKSNHVTNGLLLRADIHTLFDLHLLGIDPSSLKVVLSPKLQKTCLNEFRGRKLSLPNKAIHHPNKEALETRWKQFHGET
ncbi:MAG: HNH endonuclease [Pirellulales bacterium]